MATSRKPTKMKNASKSKAPKRKALSPPSINSSSPPPQVISNSVTAFVIVTVLGAALYVILSGHYGEGPLKWAYGIAGTILIWRLRQPTGSP